MEENKIFDSYVAYELLYESKMSNKYKDTIIFPSNWYRIINYQQKIDILLEALERNVLIIDTKKYQELEDIKID